jgi:hypothetical protein
MCIATEQKCEVCGETYWQGDLRRDHHLKCDDCRGYPKPPAEKPFDLEEWIQTIKEMQQR